jgi:eukaryotic-like serine/threonine-protein kinase
VWKAIDLFDQQVRALKLFELSSLPSTAADRARREAEAVDALTDHPAIVPCHVLFHLPGGLLALVFDLVRGEPLSDVLHDPRMTRDHRLAVLEQLGSALAHVHARGIVHRDLKPSNVIVTNEFWRAPRAPGSVKLVDFGIAAPARHGKRITAEGYVVGTTPYLAPEVLLPSRWRQPEEPFARDIFAFGVMGWELLTGEHPSRLPPHERKETFAAFYKDADEGRARWPASGLDEPIASVLGRCLALDPSMRPASGGALISFMRAGPPASSPRVSSLSPMLLATTMSHERPVDSTPTPRSSVGARTTPGEMPPSVRVGRSSAQSAPSYESIPPRRPTPSYAPRPVEEEPPIVIPRMQGRGLVSSLFAAGMLIILGGLGWSLVRPGVTASVNPADSSVRESTVGASGGGREPLPCCEEAGQCKSGHACGAGECRARVPERWWYLRISGAAARGADDAPGSDSFSDDLAGTHPGARVCVRRAGTTERETCTPLVAAAATAAGDREHRARLMTSDLARGGVEIRIEENGRVLAQGRSGVVPQGGFVVTALCGGIKLYVGPREKAQVRIFGYLDEM